MQTYLVAAVIAAMLLIAARTGISRWIDREVRLQTAEKANETTNAALARIGEDLERVTEKTDELHRGVSDLAAATKSGLSSVRREIANAKTVTLADPLPGAVAESLCVQYHKANSRNALHGKALPGAVFQLPADAFAKRCGAAWGKVTWGDVIEWVFPLMEHDGSLQRQLDAGAAYYAPQGATGTPR